MLLRIAELPLSFAPDINKTIRSNCKNLSSTIRITNTHLEVTSAFYVTASFSKIALEDTTQDLSVSPPTHPPYKCKGSLPPKLKTPNPSEPKEHTSLTEGKTKLS